MLYVVYIDSVHCHNDSGTHCVLLHASTKVSCAGFNMVPFREIATSLCSSQ